MSDLDENNGRNPTPAVPLLPYQRRWVEDPSPLKIVVKARQIGYSFAATLRVVLECLKRRTTWILLSKGERQSRLLMDKVHQHIQACGIVAQTHECDYFEGSAFKQLEARFPNGSVIYALPANPDTARGYSGNVTLDEFAFHNDADKIYSALYPTITRGYQLEVISTPNGTQGKFYDLAKAAGLAEGGSERGARHREDLSPAPGSPLSTPWSPHSCDIYEAVRQGLRINLQQLRAGCEDEAAWRQEFCCQFVSTAENFFPPELVASCVSSLASLETPLQSMEDGRRRPDAAAQAFTPAPAGPKSGAPGAFYLGIDIGRKHDRTVFWVDELGSSPSPAASSLPPLESGLPPRTTDSGAQAGASITRLVRTLSNTTFDQQLNYARELLSLRGGNGAALIARAAIDATGLGAPLAESLAQEFGPRVEPVVFTAAVKEDLAYRTRRRMENGLTLLPDSREVRRAFAAVKKFVTVTGNLRFDAERTEAGHADEFWAKALADLAAEVRPTARASDGFLADAKPIFPHSAFFHAGEDLGQRLNRRVF